MSERRKGYIEVRPEMVKGEPPTILIGREWISDRAWIVRRDALVDHPGLVHLGGLVSAGITAEMLPDDHVAHALSYAIGKKTEFRCTDVLVGRPAADYAEEEAGRGYAFRAYLSADGIAWLDDLYCRRLGFGNRALYGVRYERDGKHGWMMGDAPTKAATNVYVASCVGLFEFIAADDLRAVYSAIKTEASRARIARSIEEVDDCA